MVHAKLPPIFPVRNFDQQKQNENRTKSYLFTKHRNIVNFNSQNVSVDGTNYTLQTAATKRWKVLSNVYQHHRCGGITDQNLIQTFTFTQMLKRALCLRWLKTVSSNFQDVDFDGSLLPLFIN